MFKFVISISLKKFRTFYLNKSIIFSSLLTLLMLINCVGMINILNLCGRSGAVKLEFFFNYLYWGLPSIFLFLTFFPSFAHQFWLIPKYSPIKKVKIILLQYLYDFFSITNLYIFASIILLSFSSYFKIVNLLSALLIFITSYLITKLIKLLITYKTKLGQLIITIFVFFIFIMSILNIKINFLLIFISFIVQIVFIILIASKIIENDVRIKLRNINNHNKIDIASKYFFIFYKKKSILQSLIVAFLFKSIIIIIKIYKNKNNGLVPLDLISIISLSPILIFTYVFNNLNGYLRVIYFFLNKTSPFSAYIKFYTNVLLIPLAIDFMISLVYSFFINQNITTFLILYLPQALMLVLLGISISIIKPIRIKKAISIGSLKSNTWIWGSIISIVLVAVSLVLLKYEVMLLIYYLCILATLILILQQTSKFYKHKFSITFPKLFSNTYEI